MSLVGMRLVFAHGVAPLHVLAVLKMVAYLDRPDVREKDLCDLAHIMHEYTATDSDRRYSAEVPDDLTEFDDGSPAIRGERCRDPCRCGLVRGDQEPGRRSGSTD